MIFLAELAFKSDRLLVAPPGEPGRIPPAVSKRLLSHISLNAPVYFSSVTAPISGTASPVERNFIDVNSLSGYGFSRLVQ